MYKVQTCCLTGWHARHWRILDSRDVRRKSEVQRHRKSKRNKPCHMSIASLESRQMFGKSSNWKLSAGVYEITCRTRCRVGNAATLWLSYKQWRPRRRSIRPTHMQLLVCNRSTSRMNVQLRMHAAQYWSFDSVNEWVRERESAPVVFTERSLSETVWMQRDDQRKLEWATPSLTVWFLF